MGIARYRPDGQQVLVTAAAELVRAVVAAVGVERKQVLVAVRQGGVRRDDVVLRVGDSRHVRAHPVPIHHIIHGDARGKRASAVLVVTSLGVGVSRVMAAAGLQSDGNVGIVLPVCAEIFVIVALQTGCPSDGLVRRLGELASVGKITVGQHILVHVVFSQVSHVERLLAVPRLIAGIRDVG